VTRPTFKRPTEAALKRAVVPALKLAVGKRGRVLRMNAGNTLIVGKDGQKRRIQGVEPGTPDLLVLLDGGRCVWIELKGPKGRMELSQVAWHTAARALGHRVVVARTIGEAVEPVRAELVSHETAPALPSDP